MAWLVGGGIVLYYIVPCRPNVVNTAERTVTRNCITFATISFLFISAVCVYFYGLLFSPVPGPYSRLVPHGRPGFMGPPLFPCASLFSGWYQQSSLWPPRSLTAALSPVPACFQAGVSNHASLTTSTAFLAVSATFTPLRSA